jgi:hypothetical protein
MTVPFRASGNQAALAQLGERQTEDLKVPGSIPGGGTFVHRSRTQAVKGVDQKSTGLCPRRFESCRLRCFGGRQILTTEK